MNVAAFLRNRRDHPWPSVVDLGRIALAAGAVGLTVHPRPDERHTRASDVRELRALMDAEFPDRELNVEGYPDERFLSLVREVRADEVTLVPDAPDQATSDHGWDFAAEGARLLSWVASLKSDGHRVALFSDPDAGMVAAAARAGADRVELYTGPYGATHSDAHAREQELDQIELAVKAAVR